VSSLPLSAHLLAPGRKKKKKSAFCSGILLGFAFSERCRKPDGLSVRWSHIVMARKPHIVMARKPHKFQSKE
jgi:hypothetical protein